MAFVEMAAGVASWKAMTSLVTWPWRCPGHLKTSYQTYVCMYIYIFIYITYKKFGRHAKPRLFCTFHQNPVYCAKIWVFPKEPIFWSELLDMLTFWQEWATKFHLGIHVGAQLTRCFPHIYPHMLTSIGLLQSITFHIYTYIYIYMNHHHNTI